MNTKTKNPPVVPVHKKNNTSDSGFGMPSRT